MVFILYVHCLFSVNALFIRNDMYSSYENSNNLQSCWFAPLPDFCIYSIRVQSVSSTLDHIKMCSNNNAKHMTVTMMVAALVAKTDIFFFICTFLLYYVFVLLQCAWRDVHSAVVDCARHVSLLRCLCRHTVCTNRLWLCLFELFYTMVCIVLLICSLQHTAEYYSQWMYAYVFGAAFIKSRQKHKHRN